MNTEQGSVIDACRGPLSRLFRVAAVLTLLLISGAVLTADATTLDELCDDLSNAHECSARIESAQLPRWSDRVTRQGDTITLTLISGETVEFTNDRYFYHFRECHTAAGKCIFVQGANEHLSYVVVDLISGRRDGYRGRVTFSPDGSTFVVADVWGTRGGSMSLEIRDTAPDQIRFKLTPTNLIELASRDPHCTERPETELVFPRAGQVLWMDNDTFRFQLWCDNGTMTRTVRSLVVRRAADGWQVEKSP